MKFTPTEKTALLTRYQNGESITDLCTRYHIPRSTFYTWVKAQQPLITPKGERIDANQLYKMKQHITKLEQIIEVLQQINCTATAPLKERLCALEPLHEHYNVHVLCEALKVDRGTFYNHLSRNKKQNNTYQARRSLLSIQIKEVFDESKQIYGAKKIKAVLNERGVIVSDAMVLELMQEMNLYSIRSGAKKTYEKKQRTPQTDHLKKHFNVCAPNQVWVSDVTYFKYNNQFYYICAVIDLYARKVIAHKVSKKHSTQLISATFKLAYESRNAEGRLIFHSDRGCQYTAARFQKTLRDFGVTQSFSPPGCPRHNAVIESFFSTLKREELYRTNYHSEQEFKRCLTDYITFYNTERPHKTLGYKTPNALETAYFNKQSSKQPLDKPVQIS